MHFFFSLIFFLGPAHSLFLFFLSLFFHAAQAQPAFLFSLSSPHGPAQLAFLSLIPSTVQPSTAAGPALPPRPNGPPARQLPSPLLPLADGRDHPPVGVIPHLELDSGSSPSPATARHGLSPRTASRARTPRSCNRPIKLPPHALGPTRTAAAAFFLMNPRRTAAFAAAPRSLSQSPPRCSAVAASCRRRSASLSPSRRAAFSSELRDRTPPPSAFHGPRCLIPIP
jgi:hypothetical protein